MTDHILDKFLAETKNEIIMVTDAHGILAAKHEFKIPKPYRCWCHMCNKGFMSINKLQEHCSTVEHARAKEKYLGVIQ